MLDKLKRLTLVFCFGLISLTIFGQNNTSSPYSMFGIGDLNNIGYSRSASMGGVSSPLYSLLYLNPSNPASYTSIPLNSFIFEVGATVNFYQLKSVDKSCSKTDANIRSLAIGFPVTKWWKAGCGLNPVSSVGYNIEESFNIPLGNDTSLLINTYKGKGGVNSFYLDNSFQILKNLSIGLKVSYLFGSLDRIRMVDSYSSLSIMYFEETNRYIFSDFSYSLGLHFHKNINDNFILNAGATYNIKTNLSSKNEQTSNYYLKKINDIRIGDTISYDEELQKGDIQLPSGFALGISTLLNQKLELAIDYQKENWSDCTFFGESQNFSDNQRLGFGLEFIPDNNASKYFKIIRYRAGINYSKSYLKVENDQLKQLGASIGFGFPLRSGALFNVGFLYNHRGVSGKDLLDENYFQLNFNLSFKANWFLKRHFE